MTNYLNILKETRIKNIAKYWGWLLLAFFLIDLWWLPDSLFVYLWGKPVPLGLHVLFLALFLLFGLIAATVFFKKGVALKESSRSAFLTLLCSVLMIFLVAAAAPLALRAWSHYLFGMMSSGNVNDIAAAFTLLGLIFLLLIAAVFSCFAALTFMMYGIPVSKTGKAAIRLFKICLKRFSVFLLLTLVIILVGVFLLNIMKLSEVVVGALLPYGFFSRYILGLILAGGKTLFALFLICCGYILLAENGDEIRAEMEKTVSGSLVFPVAIAVLNLVLICCIIIPYLNGTLQFTDNIRSRIVQADYLWDTGQRAKAASEYIKAEADLMAFQAYLKGIQEIRTIGALDKAEEFFSGAEELNANSPYISYFKGMLNRFADPQNENSMDVNQLFTVAANQADIVPEARIWTVGGYRACGEEAKAGEALNLLIAGGVFNDRFAGLGDAGDKKLNALWQETEKIKALLDDRELNVILSRAEYEEDSLVLEELVEFAGRNTNPETYFQLALLAERLPYPAYMYEYAQKYWISGEYKEDEKTEIEAALFTSYMYVKSGHAADAENLMEAMYAKYPANKDIAGDYAYTLMENHKFANAAGVIDAFTREKDSGLLYLKAVACMENNNTIGALEALEGLCQMMDTNRSNPEVVRDLDEYIYKFLLDYMHLTNSNPVEAQKFLAELENRRAPLVLYHYIKGLEAKQGEDYEGSNRHFEKLLEINPALAYPYYLLGVNYNEMAGYQRQDCYPMAETYFLKFIDRRPDVVEGYFCLGSVYKHMGDKTRATRAFLRVAAYNPYRDNPLYEPFGMNNHALDEIERNK
ncbi:hypothetical protein [Phosphitispora sp. TUW77]|uniref:hypothetical protein n=1 Tax=Phosphitispora sp. TUW77 TaxID=3152361 RepID=UPI003AB59EAF